MSDSPIFDAVQRDLAGQQAREFVRAGLACHISQPAYDDDRPGMMRIHVAEERAAQLCKAYTRDQLRHRARINGLPAGFSTKHDLAFNLALNGVKA